MFLTQVVATKGLPFEARVPNAETRRAMNELKLGKARAYESVDALFADLGHSDPAH